ncbi:MAG: hypothetical protein ACM31D_20710 [Bacteroidota bacterium]
MLMIVTAPDPYLDPSFPIGASEGPFEGSCKYQSAQAYLLSCLIEGSAILCAVAGAWRLRRKWIGIGLLALTAGVVPMMAEYVWC